MSSFWNALRESTDERTVNEKPMQGWVVNNQDPMKLQRVTVRVHDLHDEIADADLPWFGPSQLSTYSGSANIGNHGPIPQPGAKVWISFGHDKSQYHGTYGGGVSTTTNQIPEFANSNGSTTPVNMPDGSQYDFGKNYGPSNGGVDGSGSFNGSDEHTDTVANIHVSSTGIAIDGKGNVSHTVNGNAPRSDNPNASNLFPVGFNSAIFGNLTLYVSGNIAVSTIGNTTISTNGTTTVQSVGKVSVLSNDEIDILSNSSSVPVNISSKFKIALDAPTITSSVAITIAPGKPPTLVPSASTKTAPTPRTRPNPQLTANDTSY